MLASGRFELRPFAESDLPAFVEAVLESTATVGKLMPWAHPNYSTADAASWFAHCEAEWERGSSYEFGIFDAGSDTFVGGCGLNQFNLVNGFCNLGYWVRQSWQRQGAALAAVQALSQFAFAELKLGRVEIVVAQHNTPSLSLAEQSGAVLECLARNRLKVHGIFTDAYVFSLVPPQYRALSATVTRRGSP
ncbi:RimJ/RimL family protein N-acetyltransferase [Acidovorax sp. 94]|uniref:GNAT family N-acetyltransferase n=1 Tax=Acidovorax sp. 94 TaxID=2135633 RepID=UPI000EAEEFAA|nr:GNAT family N-acetyltransferase [Acidovorax sp. 94]RKR67581.1 RimJ/RimL family protein N-acetyltransferase [Acidovorax sp. 94]